VTLTKDFTTGAALTLSADDLRLVRSSATLELIASAGTRVTLAQAGRVIRQVSAPTKLTLPEGSYDITATGQAGVPVTRKLSVTAGDTHALDLRALLPVGMEGFDLAAWTRAENWFTRKGGGFVLFNQPRPDGRFTYTIRLDRSGNPFSTGPRLKWVVGYVDNNTHVMMQLDRDGLYRADVVGGASQAVKIAHRIPTNVPFVHLSTQITGAQLIHQFSIDGKNWQVLDTWNRTTATGAPEGARRTLLDGRFGFFLSGDEEVFVSNFLYYPESR
jgi:hypothetical protein